MDVCSPDRSHTFFTKGSNSPLHLVGVDGGSVTGVLTLVLSIARVLRDGGVFIVRDHDVQTQNMNAFVSLAHTVFNAELGVYWEENEKEPRYFDSISHWVRVLEGEGFEDTSHRLLQAHDPSANTLLAFVKGNGGASQ